MNRLIIIGNGLDLSLGLKTKYSDFINWYFAKAFHYASTSSSGEYEDDNVRVFRHRSKKVGSIKEWLERDCLSFLRNEATNDFGAGPQFDVQFHNVFLNNLVDDSVNEWVDLEQFYFNKLIKRRTIEKINELNSEWERIRIVLIEYLKSEYDEFLARNTQINSKLQNQILNQTPQSQFLGFHHSKINKIMFLNFNYTNVLSPFLSLSPFNNFNTEMNNIHGTLDNPEYPPIFGFGDEKNENIETWKVERKWGALKNIKSFNYHFTESYQRLNKFISHHPFEALIFGHGCGNSDGTLLKTIFNNDKCVLIKIFYYNRNDYLKKVYNLSNHLDKPEIFRSKILNFRDSEKMNQIGD